MKSRFIVIIILFALTVSPVVAQDTDRSAAQFFDSIMSPYCPGMTLSACPSDDARVLRDEIREKLTSGVGQEQIRSELKSKFGNLSGAPASGASSNLGYLGILVFFAIGIGIIVLNVTKKNTVSDV